MLKIYKSKIIEDNNIVKVITPYELEDKKSELWYEFDKSYKEYLVDENSDSAVVSLLLLAMKRGKNIYVEGNISEKLYYQLNHYVINALNLANQEWKKINIIAENLNNNDLNLKHCAGTGISCGVDSFSTFYDHYLEKEEFQVDYLTFFNAGSHGDFGGEKARKLYKDRIELVKPFATRVNKEIICIDTNLNEILMMNHQQTHTIRDVACILNLQKLFKYYYYASAYRFDIYKLDNKDTASYDLLLLSMLSTESTTFYSSASQFTRGERTNNITKFKDTYDYLNVCVDSSNNGIATNCSVCPKCMRTQLTLDLLGKLKLYNNVFKNEEYIKMKDKYIGYVLATKDDIINGEIRDLIKKTNQKISLKSRMYYTWYIFKFKLKSVMVKK